MKSVRLLVALLFGVVVFPASTFAQAVATTPADPPTVIPLTGQLFAATGEPRTGNALLVIAAYAAQDDTTPVWLEHQMVTLDAAGRYAIQFGATQAEGLPRDLFASGQARWIGITVDQQPEQPRFMLVSVPYAAKAAVAETLAGKNASDFVLRENLAVSVREALQSSADAPLATTSSEFDMLMTSGTPDVIPKYDGSGALTDSIMREVTGKVGIGTSPSGLLHAGLNTVRYFKYQPTSGIADFEIITNNNVQPAFAINGTGTADLLQVLDNGSAVFTVKDAGLVGIKNGAATPTAALHIGDDSRYLKYQPWSGNADLEIVTTNNFQPGLTIKGSGTADLLKVSNTGGDVFKVAYNGDVTVSGNIAAKYQDVAEWVDAAAPLEPGTLVVIDATAGNRVTAAARAYDSRVAGAVSPQPGLILGEPGEGKELVAQSGRVRIKVDAKYGAIRPGDLLVSSPTNGHAMRSRPLKIGGQFVHRPGTIVGKALEALPKGRGEILVLLTLQ